MESVINNHYLKSYAEIYSDTLVQKLFKDKPKINGEEILQITNIKQVNLFIVKKLMDQWKKEAEKLKSPYFNYENEDVKSKLQELLNTLSRNIFVDKKHFQSLLTSAVTDTLYIIFSPYEFFQKELSSPKIMHKKNEMLSKKKFIKINAELFEAFLDKVSRQDKEEFSGEEAKKYFNKVCEEINFDPEDPDPYIDKFTEIEPIYLQKIYREIDNEMKGENNHIESSESGDSVLSQYDEPTYTLAEELENETTGTVLDFHQKQKIDSIRKNISIHHKFMFVKELFQNDDQEFNQVIDFLDNCVTRDEAIEYLENNYFNTALWNDEQEAVIEFMSVIDKKFI